MVSPPRAPAPRAVAAGWRSCDRRRPSPRDLCGATTAAGEAPGQPSRTASPQTLADHDDVGATGVRHTCDCTGRAALHRHGADLGGVVGCGLVPGRGQQRLMAVDRPRQVGRDVSANGAESCKRDGLIGGHDDKMGRTSWRPAKRAPERPSLLAVGSNYDHLGHGAFFSTVAMGTLVTFSAAGWAAVGSRLHTGRGPSRRTYSALVASM